jgi:Flp pilus assembly protein TadB
MPEQTIGEGLASITSALLGVTKALDALTDKVGVQNGRIGRLENERAAQQARSMDRSQDGIELDQWRSGIDADIKSLRESRAGMKSSVTTAVMFVSCIGTLLVLGMMVWQNNIAGDQSRHTEPAGIHQVK